MRVKVIFKQPIMKEGKVRNIGDELTIDASAAVGLASKGVVNIPGYTVQKVRKEIEVDTLVPNKKE